MPGIDPNTALIVLWGVTAVILGWTWIPALIAAMGGTRLLCGGSHEAGGLDTSAKEADFAFWFEQLEQLGYEPVGIAWMRVNFAGPEWSLYSSVHVFRHAQKQCFAFMQKAPSPFNFWPGAVFATCWGDGGLLVTDNNLAADPHPDDEFIRQGVVSLNLEKVEALHLATMEVLRRLGRKPDPDQGVDTLLHAVERQMGPDARRHYGRAGTQYAFAHGLIHICLSSPAAFITGIGHWSVPLANLVLGVVLLFGESAQKRQYAKAARAALANLRSMPAEKRRELEA
jgi:hypothetical protein